MNYYYFEPKIKGIVCKICGAAFDDYGVVRKHLREKHYQIITPERVNE